MPPLVSGGTINSMEITLKAQGKIAELIEKSGSGFEEGEAFLRIGVSAGGCSGLRYQTYFDTKMVEGDVVREFPGFDLHIDKFSEPYLIGASMDYVETIDKIGFIIDNPNASNSCACGDSFA